MLLGDKVLGSDYVMIAECDQCLTKHLQGAPAFHLPYEDTAIGWLTMNEEVGSQQTLNLLVT